MKARAVWRKRGAEGDRLAAWRRAARTVSGAVKSWLDAGLGLLYPGICQICETERAGIEFGYVCEGCRRGVSGVKRVSPPYCDRCGLPFEGAITESFRCANCHGRELWFSRARSAIRVSAVVLEVVHRYKYRGCLWFEPLLVEALLEEAVRDLEGGRWDAIVPVPLHSLKERERGFNQAERLARPLAAHLGLPCRGDLVRRVVMTDTQTHLSREDRQRNVRGAFQAAPGVRLDGERLVLVDDVMTTGATTSACAGVLRDAGAADVCVWTVARGVWR